MNVHTSIDTLPIGNYWKIIETGDVHLLLDGKNDGTIKTEHLQTAWALIEEEMFDLLAEDKDYIEQVNDERREYLRKLKALIVGDTLSILQYKQTSLYTQEESGDLEPFKYHKSIAVLEAHLGFPIDDSKMSVRKYYIHAQLMKENGTKPN
jgi:hypothetical protein